MTLARLYVHREYTDAYILRDAFAACLPSEEAFELSRFGHGVLTYVRTRPSPRRILNRARA